MKTIEQCLEGVTAGGKWQADQIDLFAGDIGVANFDALLGWDVESKNVVYAARACSTWPSLVRFIESVATPRPDISTEALLLRLQVNARAVLEEALKE